MVDLDDYMRYDDYDDRDMTDEEIRNAYLGCAKQLCHIWAFFLNLKTVWQNHPPSFHARSLRTPKIRYRDFTTFK